jgi:hypothetical protein
MLCLLGIASALSNSALATVLTHCVSHMLMHVAARRECQAEHGHCLLWQLVAAFRFVRVLTVHILSQHLSCLLLLIQPNSTLQLTSNTSSTKDDSSRASHEESSDVPKPKDSEAAHILSSSREEVDDNPSREQIHEAAKVSCSCCVCYLSALCACQSACRHRARSVSAKNSLVSSWTRTISAQCHMC